MKIAEAYVEVRAKTDGAEKDLADFERKAGNSARSAGSAFASAFGAVAVGAGIKKTIDAASELEQAVGGTAAVFGEARSEIDSFAKGAAESAGLSERAARELTSQLGGLLSGFGFTKKEAAALSIELTKLGGDLSATFGGKPEEAVQALGAAMRGETDPIERYGISLNQAAVNAKAVELGLANSTSSVDANAKAQATLAIITEKSAGAQGQFAREADSAAGKAAITAAKAEDAAASMGDSLLPVYAKVTDVVGKAADAFGALPDGIQTGIVALAGVAAAAGPVRGALSTVGDIAESVGNRLGKDIAPGADAASDGMGRLGKAVGALGIVGAVAGLAALASSMNKTSIDVQTLADATADLTDANREHLTETILVADQVGKLDDIVSKMADTNLAGAKRFIEVAEAAGINAETLDQLREIVDAKAESDVQAAVDQETNTEAIEAGTEATNAQKVSIEDLLVKMEEQRVALLAQFDSNLAYRTAVDSASDGIRELAELQKSGKATTEELDDATRALEGDMLAQADAAVKMAEDQAKANGETLSATEKSRIYVGQLQNLANQLAPGSPLRAQLQAYIDQLNAIPSRITTEVIQHIQQTGASVIAAAGLPKKKALGGGFGTGDLLEVGEAGREVVQFGQPGTVIPNHDLGRGGGTTITGPVTIQTQATSAREVYDESLWKVAG